MAYALKEQGNECFKVGEYRLAEDFYSQAIAIRSDDPKLFTNRALARIRVSDWQGVESDSRKAIELQNEKKVPAMKAHFYLAQALLNLRHVGEALKEGEKAYQMCIATKDSSTGVLSQFILQAKKAFWQAKETSRLRDMNQTLNTVETLLDQQLERDIESVELRFKWKEIGDFGRAEELNELRQEAEERRQNIRAAFQQDDQPESVERIVPDWMVDPITFEVMHDPVITPSGVSYERTAILKHLESNDLDPMTRHPLTEKMLVSNVGLKNACSEFLERNGWAVDY